MKQWIRAVFVARDYVKLRAADFLDGDDVDLLTELPRLVVVMSVLVNAGVVEPTDWMMEGSTIEEKIRELKTARFVSEGKILGRMDVLNTVERRIASNLVPKISQLVWEMASIVLTHEIMAAGFAEFFQTPPRHGRSRSGRETFVRELRKTMNHLTPREHLAAAKADLEAAKKECKRAVARIAYQDSLGKPEQVSSAKALNLRLVGVEAEGFRLRHHRGSRNG